MTLPPQDERTLKPWINAHNLVKIQGKWWKDNCEVITAEPTQRRQIISRYHDPPTMGHPGISRTTHLIWQHLWWPKLASEVEQYIKGCADCQRNKTNTQGWKAPLSPIFPQPNTSPFSTIAMDFIVKLPKSQGYDSILTITDQGCTKMAIFLPCHKSIDTEGVAQLYFNHIFPRFGVPSKIITDRDPRFTSQFMSELCKQLQIEQISPLHITPEPMANRNEPINGSNNICDSGRITTKIIGDSYYQWPNTPTTRGETKPRKPHLIKR